MKEVTSFILICLVTAVTCQDCTVKRCLLKENSLRFMAVGDFGGLPFWPYYSWAQSIVADGMGKMAERTNTHFQLSLGDNFYTDGVKNAQSDRFQNTFENVYKNKALFTPWYVIAGNHDHYGNVTAQIKYTDMSKRWVFPSLYYVVKYQLLDGTTIDIVMIDTVTLCRAALDWDSNTLVQYFSAKIKQNIFGQKIDNYEANQHLEWIEEQLRTSKADYLFVAGHYPVYSVARHGPKAYLVENLQPLLSAYNVSAYLCGHDHDLQHLKHTEKGWTVNYIVSGMGSYSTNTNKHEKDCPLGSLQFRYPIKGNYVTRYFHNGGYVYVGLNKKSSNFTFFDGKNKQLYSCSVLPRGRRG